MQISLKQGEIENAVKAYIQAQGINLSGKTVDLAFTAGRAERGLTVDITIEDAAAAAPVATGSVNQVKAADTVKASDSVKVEKTAPAPTPAASAPAAAAPAPAVGTAAEPEGEAAPAAAPAPVAKPSSLFNS